LNRVLLPLIVYIHKKKDEGYLERGSVPLEIG